MGEGDKKSPLNYSSFWESYLCDHFSSPLALKRVWVSNCDIMQVWRRLCATNHPTIKLCRGFLGANNMKRRAMNGFHAPLSPLL